ncbi:DUF1641 domain-containing protein [Subtercola sp. PAMC28395]|uniref:DUF1641 domain-containing protein n=1 Tax=Subtercola sp. PAMC28395 TaxID=2846775 RepID=UPI001C0ADCA8|nr:DUF1641 domain-containing protein [Subtercola sp. PAMC28395]QWT23106.1 DUF1641 domain-containing protein [Subtercola sp. PAMC28395]
MSVHTATAPAEAGISAHDALLARLDDPATAAELSDLLDNISTLSGLLTATGSFLARGEEVLDNVASSYQEIAGSLSADASLAGALKTGMKLAGQAAPLAGTLADTAVLEKLADPALLELLATLVGAISTTQAAVRADPVAHEYGLTRAARATRDPDVKRGIGFVLGILKELGKSLDAPATAVRTSPADVKPRVRTK